ncbi:uncharacterized protein LOC141854406 [Brevipalpus obovatus]|uniref:uncharacterized protein LOC141854406 n=1 Tax=Brevipalpus obovatus TaxID=246614 RepID=UPI003D9DCA73
MELKASVITFLITFCCLLVLIQARRLNETKKNVKEYDEQECQKILDESGSMVRPVVMVGVNKFVATLPEVNNHCEMGGKLYKGFNEYKKCLKGLARQALHILNQGIRKFMRSLCNSTKKKEVALRDLNCADKSTLRGWTQCIETTNLQLDWVYRNSSQDDVLGNLCCVYSEALDCVRSQTNTKSGCDKKANTTKFFTSSIDFVFKDVMDFVCGNYQGKDDCVKKNPEGLKKLRSINSSKQPILNNAFLIEPLIKTVARLSSEDEE